MTIQEAISNAKLANSIFDSLIDLMKDIAIDKTQIETIEDCKWSVLGHYDAEIQHAINMKEKAKSKFIYSREVVSCN